MLDIFFILASIPFFVFLHTIMSVHKLKNKPIGETYKDGRWQPIYWKDIR